VCMAVPEELFVEYCSVEETCWCKHWYVTDQDEGHTYKPL